MEERLGTERKEMPQEGGGGGGQGPDDVDYTSTTLKVFLLAPGSAYHAIIASQSLKLTPEEAGERRNDIDQLVIEDSLGTELSYDEIGDT